MKLKIIFSSVVLAGLLVITGCSTHIITANKLNEIEMGLTKRKVIKDLGQGMKIGTIYNRFGQILEIWEYEVKEGSTWGRWVGNISSGILCTGLGVLAPGEWKHFKTDGLSSVKHGGSALANVLNTKNRAEVGGRVWLYFWENRLVNWGQRGDEAAQKMLQNMLFSRADNQLGYNVEVIEPTTKPCEGITINMTTSK